MKPRNKILGALGSAAMLTVGLSALAAPANAACVPTCTAGPPHSDVSYNYLLSARAEWIAYGEHFYLYDYREDGMAAVLYYQVKKNGTWGPLMYVRNYAGVGYPVDVNLDLAEGTPVRFQACLFKGSTEKACGKFITSYA